MSATFEVDVDELDLSVLEQIRDLFPHGRIRISDAEENETVMDETDRIRAIPVQYQYLLDSIASVRAGEPLVRMTLEEFHKMSEE